MKSKIQTEMFVTNMLTLLLLVIMYDTSFFKPVYLWTSLTVNLTIMLVMTTIFTSKIEELPPTSDTKMIDIWLIFCLLVPFAFTLIQTAIECYREDEIEETHEKWAETRDGKKVVFGNKKNHVLITRQRFLMGTVACKKPRLKKERKKLSRWPQLRISRRKRHRDLPLACFGHFSG